MMSNGGRRVHTTAKATLIAVVAMTQMGCAGAGLTLLGASAGAAAGAGINYTLNGGADKTFVEPMTDLEIATQASLDRMGMAVTDVADTETGRRISAKADSRIIDIELERLSNATTRLSVVARHELPLLRDRATASAIILEIGDTLDERRATAVKFKGAAPKRKPAAVIPARVSAKTEQP